MTETNWHESSRLATRFADEVLTPLKETFVDKNEIIDLLGVSLVAGENLFLLGPPGTAKSALIRELGKRLGGTVFDYLLTRFTEPNELFGPFDIRKLREGELVTNTEGMLPEATFVFLDELLNANSAILNSLLMVLNERVFRRGRETRALPTLMVVGASNRLPEDESLKALFDRFLLRVRCDNVSNDHLEAVLTAGWKLDQPSIRQYNSTVGETEIRQLQNSARSMNLEPIRKEYVSLVQRLRKAGIPVSDRRAVKLQRPIAASALLSGRSEVNVSDLWIVRFTWETDDQRETIASIVQSSLDTATSEERSTAHPLSFGTRPNPEEICRDLEALLEKLRDKTLAPIDKSICTDRLAALAARVAWVNESIKRASLEEMIKSGWELVGTSA